MTNISSNAAEKRDATEQLASLSEAHEQFAQAFVETGNASAAYRRVYDPDKRQPAQQIWSNAARLVAHPDVSFRIRQLRDAAAAGALVRAIDLMRDWYDIATADPNEIVSVRLEACRNCHGTDHKHQWVNEAEYATAYQAYMDEMAKWNELDAKARKFVKEPKWPELDGGFGFDPKKPPADDCPFCFGRGVSHVILHDTTTLSPAARKLYKGAKQDRFGCIEVQLHDQEAAREKLARMLGAFKDGVGVPGVTLPERADAIEKGATDEQASRGYLRMIGK